MKINEHLIPANTAKQSIFTRRSRSTRKLFNAYYLCGVNLKINSLDIKMKLDTGASVKASAGASEIKDPTERCKLAYMIHIQAKKLKWLE